MSIIRYRTPAFATYAPFRRLSSLRHVLDSARQSEGWTPALEVFEDNEKITVRVESPGVKKENFDISLHDDVLTISGERQRENTAEEGAGFRRERYFGSFSRRVTLPSAVKADEIKATYQDGVLSVTLPKAEEAKPRKIEVNLN